MKIPRAAYVLRFRAFVEPRVFLMRVSPGSFTLTGGLLCAANSQTWRVTEGAPLRAGTKLGDTTSPRSIPAASSACAVIIEIT